MLLRSLDSTAAISRIARWLTLAMAGFALTACSPGRSALPSEIEVDAILASDSSFGMREGCEAAVYRLSAKTAERLLKGGLEGIEATTSPRNENPRNPYGLWAATPVPPQFGMGSSHETIYALQAIGGCGAKGDWHSAEIERALSTTGSFYAVTGNKEGMIVIAPRLKLAAYFYAG